MTKTDFFALKQYFALRPGVLLAYLFGSHARGQSGPDSDVDMAVLLSDTSEQRDYFDARLQMTSDLMSLLHVNKVDVVILNEAPVALIYRVLRDGRLLYCGDEQKRVMFTAQAVNTYLDFKPVLERHERAILERARKGKLLNGYNPHHCSLERYRQRRQRLKGITKSNL